MEKKRISTGIPHPDPLIGGGSPSYQSYPVTGKPGTVKSIFRVQFVLNGLMNGEKAVYVGVDEKPAGYPPNVGWRKLRTENQYYQDEKRWLAAALLESPEGIFVADQDGRIVFTNPELEGFLGYADEEFVGESIERVLSSFQTNESFWTEVSEPFPHKPWQGT